MSAGKCPNCGGEVKNGKCLYCDTVINSFAVHQEKMFEVVKEVKIAEAKANNKKYTMQLIITIAVIALMTVAIIISLVAYSSRIAKSLSKVFGNAADRTTVEEIMTQNFTTPTMPEMPDFTVTTKTAVAKITEPIDKIEIYNQKGRWTSGMYQIGKDIPEGTYLVMTDGQASEMFPLSLHTTAEGRDDDNFIGETWASFSRYITITEPGYIDVSWSVVYDLEKNDVENDPHKHSGMFLVGRDIEPGTYTLTFDHFYDDFDRDADYAKYYIYSDVDAVAPVIQETGDFEEGMEITLEEGEFLKLEECLIKE